MTSATILSNEWYLGWFWFLGVPNASVLMIIPNQPAWRYDESGFWVFLFTFTHCLIIPMQSSSSISCWPISFYNYTPSPLNDSIIKSDHLVTIHYAIRTPVCLCLNVSVTNQGPTAPTVGLVDCLRQRCQIHTGFGRFAMLALALPLLSCEKNRRGMFHSYHDGSNCYINHQSKK